MEQERRRRGAGEGKEKEENYLAILPIYSSDAFPESTTGLESTVPNM